MKRFDWGRFFARLGFDFHEEKRVWLGTNGGTGATLQVSLAAGFPEVSLSDHDGHWCRLDGFGGTRAREDDLRRLCSVLGIPS